MTDMYKIKLFIAFLKKNNALHDYIYLYNLWLKNGNNILKEKLKDFLIRNVKNNDSLPYLIINAFPFTDDNYIQWRNLSEKWMKEIIKRNLYTVK